MQQKLVKFLTVNKFPPQLINAITVLALRCSTLIPSSSIFHDFHEPKILIVSIILAGVILPNIRRFRSSSLRSRPLARDFALLIAPPASRFARCNDYAYASAYYYTRNAGERCVRTPSTGLRSILYLFIVSCWSAAAHFHTRRSTTAKFQPLLPCNNYIEIIKLRLINCFKAQVAD